MSIVFEITLDWRDFGVSSSWPFCFIFFLAEEGVLLLHYTLQMRYIYFELNDLPSLLSVLLKTSTDLKCLVCN